MIRSFVRKLTSLLFHSGGPTTPPTLTRAPLFTQRSDRRYRGSKVYASPFGGGAREVARRERQIKRGIIHVTRVPNGVSVAHLN